MTMNEKYSHQICWIWLVMTLGASNPKIWEYINQHRTVEETCRFVQSSKEIVKKNIVEIQTTKELLIDCLKKGIKVVCYSDSEYPNSLKDIHNPPPVLFCRGNVGILQSDRLLTVVGTRNPSDYSVAVTKNICNGLIEEGYILVSGFAIGIDSIASWCCVDHNKPTICVLASGIDYDYPKGNASLRNEVISNGGLIITEQLPNSQPYRSNFPKRNRILAGLGKGTLITEASRGSGSLITAKYTYDLGKPIFCVPPADIFNDRYLGVVNYIRDGAISVFSYRDVLYEYKGAYPVSVRHNAIIEINDDLRVSKSNIFKEETINQSKQSAKSSKKTTLKKSNISKSIDTLEINSTDAVKEEYKTIYASLNDNQNLVVQSLRKGYKYLDEIARVTNIDISELFEIVVELEMDGIIKSNFGNAYTLIDTDE